MWCTGLDLMWHTGLNNAYPIWHSRFNLNVKIGREMSSAFEWLGQADYYKPDLSVLYSSFSTSMF